MRRAWREGHSAAGFAGTVWQALLLDIQGWAKLGAGDPSLGGVERERGEGVSAATGNGVEGGRRVGGCLEGGPTQLRSGCAGMESG